MRNHAVRLRRQEMQAALGEEPVFEVETTPRVSVTLDEVALIRRGLTSLHDEIEKFIKPTKTFRFMPGAGIPNPHAAQGTARLEDITRLMKRLAEIETP